MSRVWAATRRPGSKEVSCQPHSRPGEMLSALFASKAVNGMVWAVQMAPERAASAAGSGPLLTWPTNSRAATAASPGAARVS